MSNDNERIFPPAPCEETPDNLAELKAWHRPMISRIEIAQTLQGNTSTHNDGDNTTQAAS